ncbi:hypothetical protein ASJ33_07770 [Dehalococcoides mccartyi]|uniref:hypothetical protein n=1 Tax=Dehalococcoides TaxID=61434 RepID=UPI0005B57AFB|nr:MULTISPECIES: hypothetical protein [Dehalococcoides]APH13059.1 hypothetical protein ASJ33_07770 [Dehalococcoides mccartyi]QYY57547.1 hypothetical protein CWV2_000761 [Dehalococcoides mccartyi]BAQ35282.1 hypothetical protein UCH007_13240 [Dehalococcoides sp. UCH007]
MKDIWYGDKRDLVKWGVLLTLSKEFSAKRILQVAYYKKEEFEQLEIDGSKYSIPEEVKNHFRNMLNIRNMPNTIPIDVFTDEFDNRDSYYEKVIYNITSGIHPCLVFLDPDTGIVPASGHYKDKHVLEDELKTIWDKLKNGDILACYQHRTNRNSNKDWAMEKKDQFERALGLAAGSSKLAQGSKTAGDMVIFYCQKICDISE